MNDRTAVRAAQIVNVAGQRLRGVIARAEYGTVSVDDLAPVVDMLDPVRVWTTETENGETWLKINGDRLLREDGTVTSAEFWAIAVTVGASAL